MKIPADILEVAAAKGLDIEYRALTYVKGWPTKSSKPFLLRRNGRTTAFASAGSLRKAVEA